MAPSTPAALSWSNVLTSPMLWNCYRGSLSWFWLKAMSAVPRKVCAFGSFSGTSWPPGSFCLLVEIWAIHLKQCDIRTGLCFPLFLLHSFDYALNFLLFVCWHVFLSLHLPRLCSLLVACWHLLLYIQYFWTEKLSCSTFISWLAKCFLCYFVLPLTDTCLWLINLIEWGSLWVCAISKQESAYL